jgi:hypothetical protein
MSSLPDNIAGVGQMPTCEIRMQNALMHSGTICRRTEEGRSAVFSETVAKLGIHPVPVVEAAEHAERRSPEDVDADGELPVLLE